MKQTTQPWKYMLVGAIIMATICFIWGNSFESPTASSEKSEFVAWLIAKLFGADSRLGIFLATHVRKLAHFVEYAFLGAEGYILLALLGWRNGHNEAHVLSLALLVAVLDETIQKFTERGSSVTDVLVDFMGVCAGLVGMMCIFALVGAFRRRRRRFGKA